MKMKRALCGLAAMWMVGVAAAADVPVEPALNESIAMIPNNRLLPVKLETSVFKPSGEGPFPIVVINHWNDTGSTRTGEGFFQSRYRPLPVVRQFLQRGYAVVVPMRQGYANSGGAKVGGACNASDTGRAQADDVKAVVSWLGTQAWADRTRMLMIGRGQGGWTSLAYAASSPEPGFKLFAVFSGGLVDPSRSTCSFSQVFKSGMADYGETTRVPSLWFFGANETAYTPEIVKPAFDAYVAAGAPAKLINFGTFEPDATQVFALYRGIDIWWPAMQESLAANGMPTAVVQPQFATAGWTSMSPPTAYAKLNDTTHLPYATPNTEKAYVTFLSKPKPRAFVVGAGGVTGWAFGMEDPIKRALELCRAKSSADCFVYAVNDDVVWSKTDGVAH
jgi:dienelactone hydrolase